MPHKCLFCGNFGHVRDACPKYQLTCIKCKKRGHVSKDCQMSLATQEAVVLDDDQDEDGILPETKIKTNQNLNALSTINQEPEQIMEVQTSHLEVNQVKRPLQLSKQIPGKRSFGDISEDSTHHSPDIKKSNVQGANLSDSEFNSTVNDLSLNDQPNLSLSKAASELERALANESPPSSPKEKIVADK